MIEERSFQFALKIIRLVKFLRESKEYVFADQILRSATSIGANVAEAGAGQSKKDFISKMAIASKEARETRYWLRLLNESDLVNINLSSHLDEINQIINILTKIVKTSQLKT
ncbi:four helix bundle protein [uncultured Aquimarina sp.]|uniref:four helix bundle protein n=1 Tax=uncultured Aquimarina sp. TaxID=575652 RepID=UPI00260EEEB7|nr:four helix bundle protein [uncultured Aquimarina sp.]